MILQRTQLLSFSFPSSLRFCLWWLVVGMTYATKLQFIEGTEAGNFIMWICLLAGQPVVQILYAREYYISTHEAL